MDPEIRKTLEIMYDKLGFNFDETKDLYANYLSQLFSVPYEDCLEFQDGKPNKLGKERRMLAKFLVLAETYTRLGKNINYSEP